jgi:hypothetical protein
MNPEIDEILRHMTETVQYAMREGFKQGWDAAKLGGSNALRDQLASQLAATIEDPKTKTGKVLTDTEIQALADEAEQGYET